MRTTSVFWSSSEYFLSKVTRPKLMKGIGWDKAVSEARSLVEEGRLSREQHLEAILRYLESPLENDRKIALALLQLFVKTCSADFDKDISLDALIRWGNQVGRTLWKEYGREVLLTVLLNRSVPARWVDRIADEEETGLRKALATALSELARRKTVPLERTLGLLQYLVDDPSAEVRRIIEEALLSAAERDPEQLHYFMVDLEKNATASRRALFSAVRFKLQEEKKETVKEEAAPARKRRRN